MQFTSPNGRRARQNREAKLATLVFLIVVLVAAVAHRFNPHFLELSLWQLVFANTVGVLGGGYAALWANRRVTVQQEANRRRAEERRERDRAIHALGALKKAVLHNRQQVEDVLTALKRDPRSAVFSTADPDALNPIVSRLVETVDDLSLIRETTDLRHRLSEFGQMTRAQRDLYLLPENHPRMQLGGETTTETKRIRRVRQDVLKKIDGFGGRLIEQADQLIDSVDRVLANVRQGE